MAELRFDDRIAVITGAGRGLGRAYALLLASRGAKVVVNDPGVSLRGDGLNAGPAEEVVNEIKAAGGEAVGCTESVATSAGGNAIIQTALDAYGRIDILIHNAGNIRHAPIAEMSDDDFNAVLDVHLKGAFHVLRPAVGRMCADRYGRIVLTSSVGGLYGNHKVANYAASKAGMIGLNNVAALEGADYGVKCNTIVPGALTRIAEGADERGFPIAFDKFPPMTPDMVAPVVGWLAHESCSITGEMLISIAGRVARAFIGETKGIYRPSWTIEEVGEQIDAIRNPDSPWILDPVPHAHSDHIARSFAMAREPAVATD